LITAALVIFISALVLDIAAGEAPNRFHPVAWLGSLISLQLRLRPDSKGGQLAWGIAMVVLTILCITVPLYFAISYLESLNYIVYIVISAYLLKNTFSLRGLWQAVEKVKEDLLSDSVACARSNVTALVQRDPSNLDQRQLISAAIESCAENLCDSFVAPLVYFAIFGLPGAIIYRIVNTFDAMIGYHGEWEYTGKFAARFDDLLNYVPARLSAFSIILAAAICRAKAACAWRTMWSQHGRTESPNAGWTIGAMAGSLGVMLEKAGHYSLGIGGNDVSLSSVSKSQAILLVAAAIWSCIIIGKEVILATAA
jgi:adenosylcobinamide-phosphate synthase